MPHSESEPRQPSTQPERSWKSRILGPLVSPLAKLLLGETGRVFVEQQHQAPTSETVPTLIAEDIVLVDETAFIVATGGKKQDLSKNVTAQLLQNAFYTKNDLSRDKYDVVKADLTKDISSGGTFTLAVDWRDGTKRTYELSYVQLEKLCDWAGVEKKNSILHLTDANTQFFSN